MAPCVRMHLPVLLCLLVFAAQARPEGAPRAPAPPEIPPRITYPADMDADLDHIDDAIADRIAALRARIAGAPDAVERARFVEALQAPVEVEMLFAGPVAQTDLDAFVGIGGRVDHVFRHVSYGWGGALPLAAAERLPALMSPRFLAVLLNRPALRNMDEASRTGRARAVWAPGFAGSASGFTGSATTSVAVIDTGVDGTHPDLSGRVLYWKDWYDASPTPVDYDGHGTVAAGIAVGTGTTAGASPTTLHFTDSGDLTGVSVGSFKAWPMHLPAGSVTMNLTGTFLGGGQATLGYAYSNNGVVSYSLGSPTSTGGSPRTVSPTFTATSARRYSTYLSPSSGTVSLFAVSGTTTYAGVGDGFNALSGVAPGCYWVAHKVYSNTGGGGDTSSIGYALDECVAYNATYNIKVINVSLSTASAHSPTRNKANTCVDNGMVVAASAGNTGPSGIMTDPARAAMVITAAGSSDVNELTDYSSIGNFTQDYNTDYKPDLAPPGGSKYQSHIMSVDANQSDAGSNTFADRYADDYTNIRGTSMSAPFAAGAAALVIQALEARGLTWSYASGTHPRLVKMLLCATATETNANREGGTNNPTLGRAATPKDIYEGYGLINVDAAVEAAYQSLAPGGSMNGTTTGGQYDRRAWARNIALSAGSQVQLALDVPAGADLDLYLHSGTPDAAGNPVILASSATAGLGTDEAITHTPAASGTAYVVVKRVSGSGDWSLTCTSLDSITVTAPNGGEAWRLGTTHDLTWTYAGSPGASVKIELLQGGTPVSTLAATAPIGSGGTGSFSWAIPIGQGAAANYTVRVSSVAQPGIGDTSNADFALIPAATTLSVDDRAGMPGSTVVFRAVLRDAGGAGIAGRTLSFTLEGSAIGSGATAAGGDATCTYVLPDTHGIGSKSIGAAFAGDTTYDASSGSGALTVTPAPTTLYTVDRSGTITESVTLRQYDLKRTTDNAMLSGKTITYKVDGTAVGTATTDAGGDTMKSWVISDGSATRTIRTEFDGDVTYSASAASATLTCQSWTTKMASFNRTARITDRTELKCRLLRSDNVPLYSKSINFYVDGTFIIARTTNVDGYAGYPFYTVPDGAGAGTRTILSEWPGNGGYAAISKTATLTVLKAIPYIWVLPKTIPQGSIANLYAYFRRLYDYQKQAGKTVDFKIDGTVVQTVVTDGNGVARYLYPSTEPVGVHTIRCEFYGDAWLDAGYGEGSLTIY